MTVIDISKDGSLSREEISQVALDESRAELADKLRHSPLEFKARLICVSHLTPHTAKPLRAHYELRIEFLNGDLPHSEISLVVRQKWPLISLPFRRILCSRLSVPGTFDQHPHLTFSRHAGLRCRCWAVPSDSSITGSSITLEAFSAVHCL